MNSGSSEVSVTPRAPDARERALYLVASLLSAVPLISFSVGQLIGYDGYWHVFIARQDTWQQFWLDVRANAHPPLFYLLLGQVVAFGKTALVYRAINIVAAIGSAYLVGRIVRRCGASMLIGLGASIGFALSMSTLLVAVEVRAYMLATVFCLIAFRAFLDLLDSDFGKPMIGARVSFGLSMMLALLTHYSALFVLSACLALPVYLSAISRGHLQRTWAGLRARAVANVATLALPLAAVLVEARQSIGFSARLTTLPMFMHDPARESVAAFLLNQTSNLAAMFAPFSTSQPAQNMTALAAAAFAILAPVLPFGRRPPHRLQQVPLLAAVTIGAALAVGGVLGRHPYGGELRHQYVLFPFLVIAIGAAFGSLGRWAGQTRRRTFVVAGFAALVALNAAGTVRAFPRFEGRLVQAEMDRFRAAVPSPQAVYLDQFNLIVFFMHHDEWEWRSSVLSTGDHPIDLWRLSKGERSFYVCRDRLTWMVNLAEPRVYRGLDTCRRLAQTEHVALFALEQPGLVRPIPAGTVDPEVNVQRHANEAGLALTTFQMDRGNVFAELSALAPTGLSEARKSESP